MPARPLFVYHSAANTGAEYCDERVCVCVCVCVCVSVRLSVRDHIFGTSRPIFTIFCAYYLWPWLGPALAA